MNQISKRNIPGVDFDDFSLYGCPECGCNTTLQTVVERGVTSNICPECNCHFLTLGGNIKKTMAKFPTSEKDEEGYVRFAQVEKSKHPRNGIMAHNPIDLDTEKLSSQEECCEFLDEDTTDISNVMRFVVKGRKSAKRIQRIFDMLGYEEYESEIKAFVQCEIEENSFQYMYAEISLLFDSSDYLRMDYLKSLIMENDTISRDMVLEALTKSINMEYIIQPE